jgi:hypothetical protein
MEMLVQFHGLLRWLVLLAGVIALALALGGWIGSGPPERTIRTATLIYAGVLDLQVLLGIIIYVAGNYAQFGDRQIKREHPVLMIAALIVLHLLAARARRAVNPVDAARLRTIGGAVSLALILVGIPWVRRG